MNMEEIKDKTDKEVFAQLNEELMYNATFKSCIDMGRHLNVSPFKAVMLYCYISSEENKKLMQIIQKYSSRYGTEIIENFEEKQNGD